MHQPPSLAAAASRLRSPNLPLLLLILLIALGSGRSLWSASMPMRSMKMLARSPEPVVLGSGPVTVPLGPAGGQLAAALKALPPGRSLYLLVRGLTRIEQPGVLYAVYLDLPAGITPGADDPRRVGLIQFYNARRPDAVNAPDAESPVNTDAEKIFFSFDVTTVARHLERHGLLTERTTVTIVPEGAPTPAAMARVGHLELVEQ